MLLHVSAIAEILNKTPTVSNKRYPVAVIQKGAGGMVDGGSFGSGVELEHVTGRYNGTTAPTPNMRSWMVHSNIEQRSLFSDAGSEHVVTDLSQASDAAERKEVLTSRGRSGTDTRVENIQLACKLTDVSLENEKLWLTLTQKERSVKAMYSTLITL